MTVVVFLAELCIKWRLPPGSLPKSAASWKTPLKRSLHLRQRKCNEMKLKLTKLAVGKASFKDLKTSLEEAEGTGKARTV